MGKRYVPLNKIALIEEGRFASSLDEALGEINRSLIGHVRKYGPDATKKAKATLTVKITVQHDEAESYSIKGAMDTKVPGRPAHATVAIHEIEQTGEDALFVRASGSDESSPRQMKLATDDGRAIDPESGEPKPHAKKKEAN